MVRRDDDVHPLRKQDVNDHLQQGSGFTREEAQALIDASALDPAETCLKRTVPVALVAASFGAAVGYVLTERGPL